MLKLYIRSFYKLNIFNSCKVFVKLEPAAVVLDFVNSMKGCTWAHQILHKQLQATTIAYLVVNYFQTIFLRLVSLTATCCGKPHSPAVSAEPRLREVVMYVISVILTKG